MARIVVIDDEEVIRSSLRRLLERAGHTVAVAADGEIGLALVQDGRTDLVVTDLIMPDKEGIETIQELRERHPAVRILAVSGAGDLTDGPLVDAKLFGAHVILSKPFSNQELLAAVESALQAED
jgi:DNA-binding response OmpR family regulator